MTEEEILAGCRRGDRDAQHALYAHTSDRIYRLLLRLTNNPDDAADLLQDTYIRVFKSLDRFQGASSLGTWIYRIAVNEARQRYRRTRREEEILRDELPQAEISQAGPQAAAGARMDLGEALASLPEEERALIVLRYFEEKDYAQMAEILDKPPGTIASGLNRARRRLQGLLGQDVPGRQP